MNKKLGLIACVGALLVSFSVARAASLTAITEGSFNNIEKLAPTLQANFTNLNNEVVAATAKTASGVTKTLTVATNVTGVAQTVAITYAGVDGSTNAVSVCTNIALTVQTTAIKFASGIATNAP